MAEDETLAKYCPACGGAFCYLTTTFDMCPHVVCNGCARVFYLYNRGVVPCGYPELHVVEAELLAVTGRRSPATDRGGSHGP